MPKTEAVQMLYKRPVVCLPAIDWQYLFHRPQQLMLGLARAGHPVCYLNPNQLPGAPPEEAAPNLWVCRDPGSIPDYVAGSALYFIYLPWFAAAIEPGGGKFIVYDCIDDDPLFTGHEEMMLARADMLICVSAALMEKHRDKHRNVLFLPNGVDLDHYRSAGPSVPEEMKTIKATGKPVIGFTGAFYNGWVDTGLIYFLAAARPHWQFVIVGEAYGWDFGNAPLNVFYLGRKSYEALPSFAQCFDVGLIPFIDNQIARGADPVKLYEYLAAGLPVISRRLPFVQELAPPLVYSYETAEECLSAITRALSDDKEQKRENRDLRLALASRFTWESRTDLLLSALRERTWLEAER